MAYRTAAQNLPPTGMAAVSSVGIWAALFTCMPSKHTAGAQQGMQTGLCCKADLTHPKALADRVNYTGSGTAPWACLC